MARKLERRVRDGRLAWYAQHADENFWDEHWEQRLNADTYRAALDGRFQYLGALYRKWLPRDGRIVEAGCGRAEITVALRKLGYDAEGVDYAQETVNHVGRIFPDLPLRQADVTCMQVPDGHYAGYISIGVIEHREAGPEPFVDEAFRILRPGGIGIFTVPYINPIRAQRIERGDFAGPPPADLPFYQYAYSEADLRALLERAGFEVLDSQPYGGFRGITDEKRWTRRWVKLLRRLPLVGPRFSRWLDHCRYGHMIAMVVRRPARTS